jgi:hypothetical protein
VAGRDRGRVAGGPSRAACSIPCRAREDATEPTLTSWRLNGEFGRSYRDFPESLEVEPRTARPGERSDSGRRNRCVTEARGDSTAHGRRRGSIDGRGSLRSSCPRCQPGGVSGRGASLTRTAARRPRDGSMRREPGKLRQGTWRRCWCASWRRVGRDDGAQAAGRHGGGGGVLRRSAGSDVTESRSKAARGCGRARRRTRDSGDDRTGTAARPIVLGHLEAIAAD